LDKKVSPSKGKEGMELHSLGTTDLQVSSLGLGTVQIGMPYGIGQPAPPSDRDCIHLLQEAFSRGIHFFDTAAAYGRSEELVGRAFSGGSQRPTIATKATIVHPQTSAPLRGQSLKKHLEESVRRSLERLKCEALDLLQIHNTEPNWLQEDLFEKLGDLVDRGLVRNWGASTYDIEAPLAVLARGRTCCSLQVAYSLLDRRLEREVLPTCQEMGMGTIFRSVFLQGVLSDRLHQLPSHLNPLREAAIEAEKLAEGMGISLPELAFRYVAHSPFGDVTLFGTTSSEELQENLAAFSAGPLPADVIRNIAAIEVADQRLLSPANWDI
jgi:aryl-alcohol dehydrogenase-like predicted oxidoreductase